MSIILQYIVILFSFFLHQFNLHLNINSTDFNMKYVCSSLVTLYFLGWCQDVLIGKQGTSFVWNSGHHHRSVLTMSVECFIHHLKRSPSTISSTSDDKNNSPIHFPTNIIIDYLFIYNLVGGWVCGGGGALGCELSWLFSFIHNY